MKLSVSLVAEDVAFLDRYVADRCVPTRSAAIHEAIRALRMVELGEAYAEAWADWTASGEAEAWEAVTGDGLDQAS
jgi:Arc/MetJ-type ribon-helix-helix transcriptional regulator